MDVTIEKQNVFVTFRLIHSHLLNIFYHKNGGSVFSYIFVYVNPHNTRKGNLKLREIKKCV